LNFSEFENATIKAIEDCRGAVKNCAKNSIQHLRKANIIKEIDKEMAVFRAITAEEEAAASLFFSLKNCQYKNANHISFKLHTHKQALYPFIQSVSIFIERVSKLNEFPFTDFNLTHIENDGRRAIKMGLKIKNQDKIAEPVPPLHFKMFSDVSGPITFENEFREIVNNQMFNDIMKYIKKVANQRNLLLYANNSGVSKIESDLDKYLYIQKRKVFIILNTLLMIDPWKNEGKALFVQQALDAFLIILGKIDRSDMTI